MAQGIGTLGSLTVLGMEMTHIRGVEPSACLVRLIPDTSFDRFVGDLTLSYGGVSLTATDMAVCEVAGRWKLGREKYRWDAICLDRRWKWRYPRINGEYNVRRCDGSIDESTKKNARELAELLSEALGESMDVDQFPTTVYPHVKWDGALARIELQWLCDLFAYTVCPKLDNTFKIEPITDTAELPSGGVPVIPDTFSYKPAVMPSVVRAQGTPLTLQGNVELEAVALDHVDRAIKLLSALSYNPSTIEWPAMFGGVTASGGRRASYQMVHRWFRPVDQNIVLHEHVVETAENGLQRVCLPPQLIGVLSDMDDFLLAREGPYNGPFRIRTDLNLVETEYPVYCCVNGEILPAQLKVNTGYHFRNSEPWLSDEQEVSAANRTTEPRILKHPEFKWTAIREPFYGTPAGENDDNLEAEAKIYAKAVRDSYLYDKAQDVIYDGILRIELSGAIAQIRWSLGNDWPAFTRVGVNTEFDTRTTHVQERARQRKLIQLAEAASL